ncbi:hypothetical protein [Streptomyces werraensis]|uniref:hypothetical protein n=1 Tax=Streptomyces werraensis TaxID=68284 RepID=UPI001CE39E3D
MANAHARITRLVTCIQQLEKRLSEALGKQVWREPGFGAPADVEEMQGMITRVEQRTAYLTAALDEREAEIDAAREANPQLTVALNNVSARTATD